MLLMTTIYIALLCQSSFDLKENVRFSIYKYITPGLKYYIIKKKRKQKEIS